MEIIPEQFRQQLHPHFGTANPERMHVAFWEWMVRRAVEVKPKLENFTPYRPRKVSSPEEEGPIWSFVREGATRTELSDGRVIFVGGEHEDFYDPDFCIYNDVVVFAPSNQVQIYGYPAEVFPPTDFHTATLVEDRLFIIGSLGYKDARHPGETPVHVLNLSRYEISTVKTSGEAPGWIFKHAAEPNADGGITIRGGQLLCERNGKEEVFRYNSDDYVLNVGSGIWRRTTHRKWHQFKVYQEDGESFVLERSVDDEAVLPEGAVVLGESTLYQDFTRINVRGVPISFHVDIHAIEIVVEDDFPEVAYQIAEEIRAKAEAAIRTPCILEKS